MSETPGKYTVARQCKPRPVRKMVALAKVQSESDAMVYLRKYHPRFFEDETTAALAAILVREFHEEFALMGPVQRSGLIAGVIAMMYRMGSAAIKSVAIGGKEKRKMAQIFIDSYHEENKPT